MIIGRKKELKLLERVFSGKEAEFITVYGRRRVGKTYLIKTFFDEKKCTFFYSTGIQGEGLQLQLKAFTDMLSKTFFHGVPIATPKSWYDAFAYLQTFIARHPGQEKIVIFLDELPWMVTRKSKFLEALAYYWNQFWGFKPNIILIVCGSSASWLIKKIIYNKAGLHNRTTLEMRLMPFSLSETRDYLVSRGIALGDKHVLNIYMALGGIPYYLRLVEKGITAQQNIQNLFFEESAPLKDEFNKLFDSLFENAEAYKELIELIAQKRQGIERAELQKKVKLSAGGGTLSHRLNDLMQAGFIKEYKPWGRHRGEFLMVIDEFCFFYLDWVAEYHKDERIKDFWLHATQRPAYYAWAGYAFETICLKHIDEVLKGLNIHTALKYDPWRYIPQSHEEDGAQIDLVIDRSDDAITLCEIKYTNDQFVIDKHYAKVLNQKIEVFRENFPTKKQLFLAMISAHGVKPTMYSEETLTGMATLEDLFR